MSFYSNDTETIEIFHYLQDNLSKQETTGVRHLNVIVCINGSYLIDQIPK